jgi:hypothetical protein
VLFDVTNDSGHLSDLWSALELSTQQLTFNSENGQQLLEKEFDFAQRQDFSMIAMFNEPNDVARYLASVNLAPPTRLLNTMEWPFLAHATPSVFIAEAS